MQVHLNIDHLPGFRKAVVTIGTFDGVHLGHQQIIRQLTTEARACGGESVIITFHPHPRKVVKADQDSISLLNSMEEKISLLETYGIDHLVIVPFTDTFSKMSAHEYVSEFLVANIHPHILIIGYDHRFGNDRKGNYELLEEMGPEYGFMVKEIPEHVINSITVSSTNIRKALLAGNLDVANENLGYPFLLTGMVVDGDKRGRTIGFPTANLDIADKDKLIPANGVYAIKAVIGQRPAVHDGMMNIGIRPTIGGLKRMIEVNLFEFTEDIYGELMKVSLYHYVRGEKKFSSLDELRDQISRDKLVISSLLVND
jgi:riboflavin kinase / FMN adenylyltransferase